MASKKKAVVSAPVRKEDEIARFEAELAELEGAEAAFDEERAESPAPEVCIIQLIVV